MYIETLYNKRNRCYIYIKSVLVVDKIKIVYTTFKFLISAKKNTKNNFSQEAGCIPRKALYQRLLISNFFL